MDLPPVKFPVSNSVVIGIVALIHITLVSFVITGPLIAVITEYLGLKRGDSRYDRLAKRLTQILIEVTVIGGIFGSAMVVLFLGLYPFLIAVMFNVFFWFLVLQLLAGFLVNLLFMALYYLRWESLKDRRRAHMALGIVAGVAPFIVATVFNAAVTFMTTPGSWPETGSVWHAVLNPTFLPSLFHRILASVALVGALIVGQALWRGQRSEDKTSEVAWEVRYGARLAVYATVAQIAPGLWYYFALPEQAREILWLGTYIPWLGGILASIVAVVLFAFYGLSASGHVSDRKLWTGVALLLLTVWLMGWARSATRGSHLIAGVMDADQKLLVTAPSLVVPVSGKGVFSKNCGTCHPGLAGDAVSKSKKYATDEELRAFLLDPQSKGIPMPPVRLPEEELQALIDYLRGRTE